MFHTKAECTTMIGTVVKIVQTNQGSSPLLVDAIIDFNDTWGCNAVKRREWGQKMYPKGIHIPSRYIASEKECMCGCVCVGVFACMTHSSMSIFLLPSFQQMQG